MKAKVENVQISLSTNSTSSLFRPSNLYLAMTINFGANTFSSSIELLAKSIFGKNEYYYFGLFSFFQFLFIHQAKCELFPFEYPDYRINWKAMLERVRENLESWAGKMDGENEKICLYSLLDIISSPNKKKLAGRSGDDFPPKMEKLEGIHLFQSNLSRLDLDLLANKTIRNIPHIY